MLLNGIFQKIGCFILFIVILCAGIGIVLLTDPEIRQELITANAQSVDVGGDPVNRVQLTGKNADDDLKWALADKTLDEGYAIRTDADIAATQNAIDTCSPYCKPPSNVNIDNGHAALAGIVAGIIGTILLFWYIIGKIGK